MEGEGGEGRGLEDKEGKGIDWRCGAEWGEEEEGREGGGGAKGEVRIGVGREGRRGGEGYEVVD